MSERIFPAWPAAPVQPYTAREVAQDSLDIHMANCTLCLEDRKCDDVPGLVDALAALSKCAICGTVSPPGYADETLCATVSRPCPSRASGSAKCASRHTPRSDGTATATDFTGRRSARKRSSPIGLWTYRPSGGTTTSTGCTSASSSARSAPRERARPRDSATDAELRKVHHVPMTRERGEVSVIGNVFGARRLPQAAE
jgi:hypothetical protein